MEHHGRRTIIEGSQILWLKTVATYLGASPGQNSYSMLAQMVEDPPARTRQRPLVRSGRPKTHAMGREGGPRKVESMRRDYKGQKR